MREQRHRLIFIDETGTTTKMTRLRGRARKGERLNAKAPFGHWGTQTFVAGLRCDGLVAPWVIDAPMFEETEAEDGTKGWTAVHHPFTSPNEEWRDRFEESPGEALAWAYDIVCNGNEIGGGSIRIHQGDVQERVFAMLGMTEAESQEKFGFLLDAFKFGPPPHGGIAIGWDRTCMLLAGAQSLREVIAFPKTGAGHDPLTGAPTPITAQQRKEAGIDAVPAEPSGAIPV
jgi:aspartyl-tRNA synthetase